MSGVFDTVLEAAMVFAERAAKQLGFELFRVSTHGAWAEAIRKTAESGADATLVVTPFGIFGWGPQAEEAVRHTVEQRLPAIFAESESVERRAYVLRHQSGEDLRRGADLLARVLRAKTSRSCNRPGLALRARSQPQNRAPWALASRNRCWYAPTG
jgi:hypothetical protein